MEVGAHDDQRVRLHQRAAAGLVPDNGEDVLQEGAVSAAHVGDAEGLLLDGPVEDLDHDLVDLPEVRSVCTAASPHIHAPIDVCLPLPRPPLPEHVRIPEEKFLDLLEHRQVGDGDSIGRRPLTLEAALASEPQVRPAPLAAAPPRAPLQPPPPPGQRPPHR